MTEPSLLDAHVHLWDPDRLEYRWLAGTPLHRRFDLADFTDAAPGVTAVVAVQADCRADQSVAEVRWLTDQFADRPALLHGIVAHVPVEDGPAVRAHLAAVAAAGPVVGIRRLIQDEPAGFTGRTGVDAGLAVLTETGLPFDLCIRAHQLGEVTDLVERHPEQTFVLDHLGKPPVGDPDAALHWRAGIRRLARHPRVGCKLSGLAGELVPGARLDAARAYLEYALDAFGVHRCMFGSDWPVVTVPSTHATWLEIVDDVLSTAGADERAAVFGGTARRVYAHRRTDL
jgi:L-fuconolactonase